MADVNDMQRLEKNFSDRRLRGVLEELATACSKHYTLMSGKGSAGGGGGAGRTKLDKERTKLVQREIVSKRKMLFYCIPNKRKR